MKMNLLMWLSLVMLSASNVFADINDLRLTEVWPERSGSSVEGTRDWIEVTNTGDTPVILGPGPGNDGVAYDDESANINVALIFPNETLMPGESIILLLDSDPDNTTAFTNSGEEFLAIWDPFEGLLIGSDADGGLSSSNGDSANLLNATTGAVIDTITFSTADLTTFNTVERTGEGATDVRPSVLGEGGAYETPEFADEDGTMITLIGSPGIFQGFDAAGLLGDVNCDGTVDLLDVQPFVQLISNSEFSSKADINMDGNVDLLDVGPFIELLTGG